jgi:2-oxoglutarate dehydrogenase E2 component (dihydrolipoamide succinyltransferase)
MLTDISVSPKLQSGMRLSVGRWLKKVGDAVTRDEPLVEIDTGNVTHEVCASVTGVLSEILVKTTNSLNPRPFSAPFPHSEGRSRSRRVSFDCVSNRTSGIFSTC